MNHVLKLLSRRDYFSGLLDIKASYARQVQNLEDQRYHAAIEPHLAAAYERYPSENEITARLKQHCNVISYAESLARVPVHQKRPVSFIDFMKLYTGGGLPLVPLKRT